MIWRMQAMVAACSLENSRFLQTGGTLNEESMRAHRRALC